MKKKESNSKKPPPPTDIVGDESGLVGAIVEKGFSQNPTSPSLPRPTVLPFPVARHRSHGPHWAPKGSSDPSGVSDDDNEDDRQDEKLSADFANPVQRKQKKSLDFSRWRELITDDGSSVPQNKIKSKPRAECQQLNKVSDATGISVMTNRHVGVDNAVQLQRLPGNVAKEQSVDMEVVGPAILEVVNGQEQDISDMDTDGMNDDYMSESIITSTSGSRGFKTKQEAISLGDQIDAENRARLERMSADEIAEAQADLKKLSPALLEMLKKRGQDKSKKQKRWSSDMVTGGQVSNLEDEKDLSKASTLSQGDISHDMTIPDSKETNNGVADDVVQEKAPGGNSWEAWSKRVEAVRYLRFTLEGNVTESEFVQASKDGNISAKSGYSVDNVSERDFLRTDGDPAAAGYTIKEALALVRSVVPGQRALALHLLASVLDKALCGICQNPVGGTLKCANTDRFIDWEAVLAFVLGPEPELALLLRMSLDDNHTSVVLAGAKVIQSALSCDINDNLFDISEKTATYQKYAYTSPVFRSRPKIEDGFLGGGFWKYNSKPSNLLPFDEDCMDDKPEGEQTVQDDVVVAGQDIAAGLVRMGIIARIRYLLETDPSPVLEEYIITILIAVARHSPACADAIMKCHRLVQIVVNRFTMKDQMEVNPSKIKAVTLLKVLAQSEKKNCVEFIKNGTFQKTTWHLYRYTSSLDHWVKSGRENCKLSSVLLVEQLRFWKVCIHYGYCISNFIDLLPALCIWLDIPTFENLAVNNILEEFAAITKEAYLVLEVLCRRLPNFYSQEDPEEIATEDKETWCWSHVGPIVESALKWTALKSDPYLCRLFDWQNKNRNNSVITDHRVQSLLCVISAVTHMLSGLLARVIPEDASSLRGGHVPWLPEFVPKIGLEIIKNGVFSFTGVSDKEYGTDLSRIGSFVEYLCQLRHRSEQETSIASVDLLHGLIQVVIFVDKLIRLANIHTTASQSFSFSKEDKILANGILKSSVVETEIVLTIFMDLIDSEWESVLSIDTFGRGGPAPGVGVGWGASGGGYWSTPVLLAQMDAKLIIHLLEIFPIVCAKDLPNSEEMRVTMRRINCALHMCLILGPKDRFLMDKLLDYLLQVPVLKCLDLCIHRFIHLNKGFKLFEWQYKEEDYLLFTSSLTSHFKKRWLCIKKKSTAGSKNSHVDHKPSKKSKLTLDTILEESEASNPLTSLVVEWAHQRLPLPSHWILSPFSPVNDGKASELPSASNDLLEVAKGGLFLLLGIEAMSASLSSEFHSSLGGVPPTWKLHSLSASLSVGMGVLEEKSRDMFENLQEVYGQLLDNNKNKSLKFQSDIHESYSTFVETLVEHFASVSYGDLLYGRQVAIYLHRVVEAPIRLATWKALSNARVLELLPPIQKCVGMVEGYLEPVEDDEKILEAFVISWTSGALDKAVARGSIASTLVLHHFAAIIFGKCNSDKILQRNRLVEAILLDYSQKPKHEGMMLSLIQYDKLSVCQKLGKQEGLTLLQTCETERRFKILKEACTRSRLKDVEKLESCFTTCYKI